MKLRYSILLVSIAIFLIGTIAASSAAKAPAKKVNAKPKTATKLGAIGTAQLPGEWCEFGKAYTLGNKKDGNAINLTLKSAEYTIEQINIANRTFWPKIGEKLLVLHYTLHNPLPKEQRVDFTTISWTAVDAKSENKNQEYRGGAVDDKNQNLFDQTLKPAQKIDVFTIIRVDAYGPVPKLMAALRGVPSPVARYDMAGKIKPLTAPYADPSDKTGATMAKVIPGVIGTSYITGAYVTKIEKVEFINPPFDNEGYKKDEVYVVVTIECTNMENGGGYGGSQAPTSGMKLKDVDEITYTWLNRPMPPSSTRRFDPRAEKGETFKFRLPFSVPKGIGLKSLTVKEWSGNLVEIDLSAYKTPQ